MSERFGRTLLGSVKFACKRKTVNTTSTLDIVFLVININVDPCFPMQSNEVLCFVVVLWDRKRVQTFCLKQIHLHYKMATGNAHYVSIIQIVLRVADPGVGIYLIGCLCSRFRHV